MPRYLLGELNLASIYKTCAKAVGMTSRSKVVLSYTGGVFRAKETASAKTQMPCSTWGGAEGRPALRRGQGGVGKGQIMKRAFSERH